MALGSFIKRGRDMRESAQSDAADRAAILIGSLSAPALVMDDTGKVLAANRRAMPLHQSIDAGAMKDLQDRIISIAHQNEGLSDFFDMPEEFGGGRMDVSLIPLEGGLVMVLGRDIVLDSNLRDALTDSRQRYKDLVELSSDFSWEIGPDGTFAFVSPGGALGWEPDDLVGERPEKFLEKGPLDDVSPEDSRFGINPFHVRQPLHDGEVWFHRADGTLACLGISVHPLLNPDGEWRGARGICHDVTESRERDAALAQANGRERLLGFIIRTMRDEVDPMGMMKAAAEAVAKAITSEFTEIHRIRDGVSVSSTVCGDRPKGWPEDGSLIDTSDARLADLAGGCCLVVPCQFGGSVNGVLSLWRHSVLGDWSGEEQTLAASVAEHLGLAIEQICQHEQLQELSRTDGLTGLLNRRSFVDDLVRRHARVQQGDSPGALVYCDLDNFKQVNDTHGHERGDAALRELAQILTGSTRGGDLVARLGGDEFALWLESTDAKNAKTRAEELLDKSESLKAYSGGPDSPLSMSVGIAVQESGSAESLEELMARADSAMYDSKKNGKGRFTIVAFPGNEGQNS